MTKWFVVADKYRSQPDDPEDCVWTLSRNPYEIGWETDSGCPGYGLLKKDAEELVGAADRIEKLETALREIASVSKVYANGEDMAQALTTLLASHRQIALTALKKKDDN